MQRENRHFFSNTFYTAPLETWTAAIQRQSSGAEHCSLEEVVHYKALLDIEHEFLVVYARHPFGSKIVLGVDRNARDLATAASRRTSGSASQDTDTTQLSTGASSLARYLNRLVCANSLPTSSSTSSSESSHLAYDSVQVSHDGTPAPILAQHGPCVPLYTITFSSTSPPLTASTSTSTSNSGAKRPPSLLHLSILLLTIRTRFPSYDLLQYQCYFFARVTWLALMDLFGGVETELVEGKRAGTWRGVHVSLYSPGSTPLQDMLLLSARRVTPQKTLLLLAGLTALQNMLLLPLVRFPALILPAVAMRLYVGNVVGRRISDKKIRQHAIPKLYRAAWRSFVQQGR